MLGAYYDIEVFGNYVSFLFLNMENDQKWIDVYIDADIKKDFNAKQEALSHIDYRQFILHNDQYDAVEFYNFMRDIKLLIGYNSIKFDNLIVDYMYVIQDVVLSPGQEWWAIEEIRKLVNKIIENNNINYKYYDDKLREFKEFYISIDLLMALFETVSRKSLKQAAINIKWYRIEDLPIKPNAMVNKSDFQKIFDYNLNDVLITRALHLLKKKEFELRINISAKYDVNVITSNRSTIADKLMAKFYSQYTGLKHFQFKDLRSNRIHVVFNDILNPKIHFITPELKQAYEEVRNTDFILGKDFEKVIIFRDKGYTIATGGLHSIDRPNKYECDASTTYLRDADVSSYYPALIEFEGVCPAHLAPVAFHQIVHMIRTDRIAYKTQAKILKKEGRYAEANDYSVGADTLKIVANSGLFGKLGYDGWLHDPKAMYQVTLNGQFYLIMLIEQLEEAGIEVISANTDGILSRFTKDKLDEYNKITTAWQKFTKLDLEFTDYIKYVRTSVNDYIAIKKEWLIDHNDDENIKRKGDFLIEVELSKGFNAPIVAIAIDKFILYKIPIEDTIINHTDIYDYCISVKTGEKFEKKLHRIENGQYIIESLSKNLRYFVSNHGGTLLKHSSDQIMNMNKGALITPFNDYFPVQTMSEYDINYNYYIKRASDILLKIEGVYNRPGASRRFTGSKKKGVDRIGKMFDNI